MRVLVAGRNAKVLAQAAGTFSNDLEIHTAATKAACFVLLGRVEFDLVVACETLGDGSGLEVLSHVAVNTPNTLRIFAARPATLVLLKSELGLFGLFRTLPYPINFRKLWAAISLARGACEDLEPAPQLLQVEPVRLPAAAEQRAAAPASARSVQGQAANAPRVQPAQRAVTVTGARPAQQRAGKPANARPVQQQVAAPPGRAAAAQAAARQQPPMPAVVTVTSVRRPAPAPARQEITSGMRAAARYAAAHAAKNPAPARIPESDAFKRARARRDAGGRLEPVVSNESLAQLAKLALTKRPPQVFRGVQAAAGKKRAALFVGSGVFAATTAMVLTFFLVSANNSVKHPKLPVIASITQPMPNKAFPWQPETQQPTRQAAFMRSEAPASAVADLEAEAEAASESPDGDPDHPGPPPPNAPPPPSEPPSLESPAQWVNE